MKNLTIILALVLGIFAASAIAKDNVLLDQTHAAKGIKCNSCHGTGERQAVPMLKCVQCHNTEKLALKTENLKPTNPITTVTLLPRRIVLSVTTYTKSQKIYV